MIILDGAMGTYLKSKGREYSNIPLTAIEDRNLLIDVHKEYLCSGADCITTNTFTVNPKNFKNNEMKKIILKSIECAKESVRAHGKGKVIYDIGALGISVKEDYSLDYIRKCYISIRDVIEGTGIEYVLIETQYILDEAIEALKAFQGFEKTIMLSFTFKEDLTIASGENIEYIIERVKDYNIFAIGLNCCDGFDCAKEVVKKFKEAGFKNIIAKPNNGIKTKLDDEMFLQGMLEVCKEGANIIGGCCGTTPQTIKTLSKLKK